MKEWFRTYTKLTKLGISLFVIIGGLCGFALSHPIGESIDLGVALLLSVGLYLTSAGSFVLNQAQEKEADRNMPRTQSRPLPQGKIATWQAYVLGLLFCIFGILFLLPLGVWPAGLCLATIILYNVFYTLFWKKKWAFAAVPGAIPGAAPVLIGYSVNHPQWWTSEAIYLFLIMFLWQMPHFWSLAIRYKDDYLKAQFPVLPVVIGEARTTYHMGLYLFVYAALALASPWFVKAHIFYLLLVVPFAAKIIYEFYKFQSHDFKKGWLAFFLWVNFSVLAFLLAPVLDKWIYYRGGF